jgi:hypothetical protein
VSSNLAAPNNRINDFRCLPLATAKAIVVNSVAAGFLKDSTRRRNNRPAFRRFVGLEAAEAIRGLTDHHPDANKESALLKPDMNGYD